MTKFGLSGILVLLFAIAILPMPMAYYYFLRIAVGFTCLITIMPDSFDFDKEFKVFAFLVINHIILVILLNPIFIISFDRDIWIAIDIWAIIIYGIHSIYNFKSNS